MKENIISSKDQKEQETKQTTIPSSHQETLRVTCVIVICFLSLYLPLDHGGFYPASKALLSILACSFLSMKILFPTGEKYPKNLTIAFSIFFTLILISVLFSTDIHKSVLEFIYMLSCAVGFILGYCYIKRKGSFRYAVYVMYANVLIASFFGILTFILQKVGETRAFGRFFQADILGGFLVIFIPLTVMMSLTEKKQLTAGISLFVSAISIATLFLTFSRGAVLSFLIIIPLLLWYAAKFQSFPKVLLRCLFVAVLVIVIIFGATHSPGRKNIAKQQWEQRIEEIGETVKTDSSSLARLNFYSAALQMALSRPLTGTGPGTFGYHFPQYQKDVRFFSKYPHNYYLWILSQSGFPALISFLALLLIIGLIVFRRIKALDPSDGFTKPAVFALSLGLLSSLAHINLDVDFHFAGIAFNFFAVAGILAGIGQETIIVPEAKLPQRLLRVALALLIALMMLPPLFHYFSVDFQKMGDKSSNEFEALAYYKRAVGIDPFDNEARRKLGVFLYNRKRYEEALEQFNYSIRLSPYRARNFDDRGRTLDALSRFDEAARDYETAIKLDPMNQLNSYYGLGMYYHKKGENPRAMEIFNEALTIYKDVNFDEVWHFRTDKLKPQLSLIYVTKAEICIDIGDFDNAAESYENAARYNENAATYFGRAFVYFNRNEWSKALDSFRYSLWVEDHAPPYYFISECYRKSGNNELAEKNLQDYFRKLKD